MMVLVITWFAGVVILFGGIVLLPVTNELINIGLCFVALLYLAAWYARWMVYDWLWNEIVVYDWERGKLNCNRFAEFIEIGIDQTIGQTTIRRERQLNQRCRRERDCCSCVRIDRATQRRAR